MAAGQGIFISSVLYYKYRNPKPEIKYFSLYLLSFSLIILYWTTFWINNMIGSPLPFVNFGEPLAFILAPALYFYITEKNSAFWPHALPALLPIIFLTPIYLDFYLGISWAWYTEIAPHVYFVWTTLNIIQISIYIILIEQHDRSNPVPVEQKFGLLGYAAGIFLYLIMLQTNSLTLLSGYIDYIICALMIFMVYKTSYKSFLVKNLFSQPVNQVEIEKGDKIIEEVKAVLAKDKYYLNPSFKLNDLAELVNQPRHVLSKVLNDNYNISFNDFINEYRIRHAEYLLKTTNDKLYSVALDSGFSNKVSFINNFKKIHNITPAVFRKQNLEGDTSSLSYYPTAATS
ncbi:MAG: helix-turn-helix domain-containing protein [Candidatus Cyclobacteriaceae bacterium M2_1C_046]